MIGRLQQTIAQYRQELLAHEAQAEAALSSAYQAILGQINTQLDVLYSQIDQAMSDEQELSPSWLYEANRLQSLEDYITGAFDHYGMLARTQVGAMQSFAAQLGQAVGMASLDASVPRCVSWSFGVPSPDAIASLVGATQQGSPLWDLFTSFGSEAAQGAKTALISGVSLGYNPRDIAPMVQAALGVPQWRALTIARTEALRSYRDANLLTFQANNDVMQGWIWQSALDRGTCAACIAMNGTQHDLSEDMASHPNCRCVQIPLTKSWDSILGGLGIDTSDLEDTSPDIVDGSDWFSQQSEATQKAILGPAKYEAWNNGDFDLSDIVGKSYSADWGSSIYEKPLKELANASK